MYVTGSLEKIKEARKLNKLTQEEFANKLMVSTQAVAKWEADKGIPDIENLKQLSSVLGVSIDYLLFNGETIEKSVIREKISLASYGKGSKKKKKDFVMKEKYSDATINSLMMLQKSQKSERIIDNVLGFVLNTPFGIPQVMVVSLILP